MDELDKPHFIARRFQNAQRLAAKGGYSCPLCMETFLAEPKLWSHAKLEHHDSLELADSTETQIRIRFRQAATEKAQKSLSRTVHHVEPAASKQSSNDNDSIKPNIGDDVRSRSAQGTSPLPGSSHNSEKGISDISKLTLGQDHNERPACDTPTSPSAISNPLKRGVGGVAGQNEEADRDPIPSRARRAKGRSTGQYTARDLSFSRTQAISDGPRKTHGPNKRLFNPEVDSPVVGIVRHDTEWPEGTGSLDDPMNSFANIKKLPYKHLPTHQRITPLQDFRTRPPPFTIIKANHETKDQVDLDQFGVTEKPNPTVPAPNHDLELDQELDPEPVLLLQPETRPISHEQLVVEVKGIYAGLMLVESKCIDVDENQSKAAQEKDSSRQTKLTHAQWQALIHLHKTLLHEHHDFFLASQHPSASLALSKLAARHRMPARMWRHGIHAFLEVLRMRLPESKEHMLAFIYIAYSMMALLYETVSTFECTWIECLGDLGRYRMAIEDDDPRDRDVWSGVARYWYSKGVDKNPNVGRLYHHLAILARPYSLEQLSYYARSLTSVESFDNARSSIMALFNLILSGKESAYYRSKTVETTFIKAHGILFRGQQLDQTYAAVQQLEEGLMDSFIARITLRFREQGVFAALANISALFEYGLPKSIFRLAYDEVRRNKDDNAKPSLEADPSKDHILSNIEYNNGGHSTSSPQQLSVEQLTPSELKSSQVTIACASRLTFSTLSTSLQRLSDKNVWHLVHVSLVFLWSLTIVDKAMQYVEQDVPWSQLCSFLNNLARPENLTAKVLVDAFPQPETGGTPLPEDFALRGQVYSQWYFPDGWFKAAVVDDEERTQDPPSMVAPRLERILWLGMRIASCRRWILYDENVHKFRLI